MRLILLLTVLVAGCAFDDQALRRSQLANCPEEDRFKLRVGMSEAVMLACSFPGYKPYRTVERVDGRGTVSAYEGMWQPERVWVVDGRVAGWDAR